MDMEIHDRETFALPELDYSEPPAGSDRRAFMMRSAMAAAIVAVGGTRKSLVRPGPGTGRRSAQAASTQTLRS